MDLMNHRRVRFRIDCASSEGLTEMDSWVVEEDNSFSAKRTITKLAYKYMSQVVNDALYDPEDCSLTFSEKMDYGGTRMPIATIKHKNDIIYSIESYMVIQIDPIHFQYRGYVITVDASHGDDGVCHIVDGSNGFYECAYDIVDQSVNCTLPSICKYIDAKF